jgi:hypothetical protein
MLPTRHSALTHALSDIAQLTRSDAEVRLRVGLLDGRVIDGFLVSATPEHVSLRLPSAQAQAIAVDQIRSLHLATRRPVRELLTVFALILGVTAMLVAVAQFPMLRPYLPRIAGGLAILGFALIMILKRRTALGTWLTSWRTLFEA